MLRPYVNPKWILGVMCAVLAPSLAAQPYTRQLDAVPVRDAGGVAYSHPWLGGLNVPRPQFLDIDADGDLDLFVQERPGGLIFFENTGSAAAYQFTWRTDTFEDLDVGEWARFADLDKDGDFDVLAEEPFSFVRYFRNEGSPETPAFQLVADSLNDVEGVPIFSDRQNIPALADIDCDSLPDLFVATLDGFLTFYENEAISEDGLPQFRFITDRFQDIAIVGEFGKRDPGFRDDLVTSKTFKRHVPLLDRRGQGWWIQNAENIPSRLDFLQGGLSTTPSCGHPSCPGGESLSDSRFEFNQHGANSLTFTDIDGDDDLDLFWGDFFSPSLYFLENAGDCEAPALERTSDVFPVANPLETSGFNAPVFADLDDDGDQDLFVGVLGGAFGGGPNPVDNFYFYRHDDSLAFALQTRQLISGLDVDEDSTPAFVDLDDDGDLDLVVGNKIDRVGRERAQLFWFENDGTPGAPAFRLADENLVNLADRHFNTAPTFADLDDDGDQDLLLGGFDGRLAFYRNDGTPTAPAFGLPDTLAYQTIEGQTRTLDIGQSSVPALVDIDGDEDFDLLIGESSGRLNLFRNDGTPEAADFVLLAADSLLYQSIDVGSRSAPAFHDVTGDGVGDLVVGSGEDAVLVYRNTGTAQEASFVFDGSFAVPGTVPRNAAPAFADLDTDGDDEVFIGGLTGGLFFYRNDAIITATEAPAAPPSEPLFLLSNYPNPFRDATTVRFRLARPGRVRLVVYDVLGRLVATPVDGFLPPGDHRLPFDARRLPSGVYFYSLTHDDGTTATGTMLRVR